MLLSLLHEARLRVFSALAASAGSGLASAALLASINDAISGEGLQPSSTALRFAAISLAMLGLRWAAQVQFVHLGQGIAARLRERLSARFAHSDCAQLERGGAGRMTSVLTDDVDAVAHLFVALPELALQSSVVVGCLVYLGWLSPTVLLVTVALVAGGAVLYNASNLEALERLRLARLAEDRLFRHFRALFDGRNELRLNARLRRAFLERCVGSQLAEAREQRTRGLLIYARAYSWGSFSFFALIGSVLFLVPLFMAVDGAVMSAYALTFLYLILPLESVLGSLPALGAARVAFDRIETMTSELSPQSDGLESEQRSFRSLRLRGVEHVYRREGDDGEFVLGPIDLSLRPGELVFLTGGNGSGKTTLAKVVAGLFAPQRGEIWLDDRKLGERDRGAYRQLFSAVFSDFHLFDGLYGAHGASSEIDASAARLLRELRLAHKVRIEQGLFSTTELSLGQRKRLALLAATLEDRPLLVLDEWAADQDPGFKHWFYRQLLPELSARGKCVLVITHDDRYFDAADRRLVLSEGRVSAADGDEPIRSAETAVGADAVVPPHALAVRTGTAN